MLPFKRPEFGDRTHQMSPDDGGCHAELRGLRLGNGVKHQEPVVQITWEIPAGKIRNDLRGINGLGGPEGGLHGCNSERV